jgi:hypothetical protein
LVGLLPEMKNGFRVRLSPRPMDTGGPDFFVCGRMTLEVSAEEPPFSLI